MSQSVGGVRRVPTVLCFDVEDIVAPESDDAALWMAEILAENGLTGSFMVVGEKARLFERRGRRDVIEALKRHDLAFHSTWHSVHPTTAEICIGLDFAQGMEALHAMEAAGWADAERVFGRPMLGWARNGYSWAPSVMGLMGRMGRAYMYGPARLPGHDICWYGGCLSFYDNSSGGFDTSFRDDGRFAERLVEVRGLLEARLREEPPSCDYSCFFIGHPTRVISTTFWDEVNFSRGANPPRGAWRPAPLVDSELIPTIQGNWRRLCEYLRTSEYLEVVGWGELIRRYDGQRAFASDEEVREIAQRAADERRVIFTDLFTASEILLLFCGALRATQARYPRPVVCGPLTTPPTTDVGEIDAEYVKEAARTVEAETARTGCLPAAVTVGGRSVGIGWLFVALAEAVLGRPRVSGPADAPYPEIAEEMAREVARGIPDWRIHPEGMDLAALLEQTRLQCWTLKPALTRDAVGK